MICMCCGNQIIQSRYGWQASTLCIVCLDQWQDEELVTPEDDDEETKTNERTNTTKAD